MYQIIGLFAEGCGFCMNEEERQCILWKQRFSLTIHALARRYKRLRFLCGMELGAGLYASEIILGMQKLYPKIQLECVIPFEEFTVNWPECYRDRYFSVLSQCTKETLLQTRFTVDCLQKRRQYITDKAHCVFNLCELSIEK